MSTRRRLEVEVVATVGGFTAAMNRVNAGITRVSQGFRRGGSDANYFSRQLMAVGTTARYYLAGRLIFGIQSAITNLADFKTQLGEVDALASRVNQHGQLTGLGDQLDKVGESALLMSNKFGIAIPDIEQYMQRFFSSFNPPGSAKQRVAEMNQYTTAILNLTTALGTEAGDPSKLAGGLTGLINAMPGGRKHPGATAKTISDYFAVLLRQTPSLTGADIASAAGRFASAKTLAKMSVPQILSAFGVAAQTGGSPAVMIRGITQLLGQSLMHPTRPQSLRTYQMAGLPTDPNALAGMGGQKVLERLITFVQQGGPAGSPGRRTNLDAIYNAFSRQESVRQFVNILAQGGVPALRAFNRSLQEGAKESMAKQMADKRLRQSTLLRMQKASTSLGVSLVSGADWPLEHLVADPLIATSNAAIKHRTTTQAVIGGALALGAGNALRRLGAFRGMGRLGKFGRFLGAATGIEQAAIGGAISKEELPAAISGGATDGTRSNPFWVIISPLSWSLGGPTGTGIGGGGGDSPGFLGKLWKKGGRIVPLGKGTGVAAVVLAGGYAGYEAGQYLGRHVNTNKIIADYVTGKRGKGVDWLGHDIKRPSEVEVKGQASVDVRVHLVDKKGQEIGVHEKKGVPVKLWNAKQYPSSKGKPGSRKGSGK